MLPTEEQHGRINYHRKRVLKLNLRLSTRKALLLSVIVIAGGIWFSLQQMDWSWFARSGSLIVIIGILLTSSQIIENSHKLKIRRSHYEHNFNRDFANDIKKQALERSRHLDEDIWENALHGLYLLVSGTLIWSFGDLVGLLI